MKPQKMRIRNILNKGSLACITALLSIGCGDDNQVIASKRLMIKPEYKKIKLLQTQDSLHFAIGEKTYNEIKSFNCFVEKNISYISFYDRRSESVNIYNFQSRQLTKKIRLKKHIKAKRYFKTSVFVKNFDSILVANLGKLYLIDSSGNVKKTIPFIDRIDAMAYYDSPVPVVMKENKAFMGVRPYVKETSLSDIRDWKIMYVFDLQHEKRKLLYELPDIYKKGLYGARFLTYSYCVNEKGNFVFSFPADTNIYETNLSDYHMEYYAKSRFHTSPIAPITKESLEKDEGGKEYTLRNSYGSIYFDPNKKIYLRVAKCKVSAADYETKNYQRTYSLIFFDQHFKIIGESVFKNTGFSTDNIFFAPDGNIYVRVMENDEYALHFLRLGYFEENESKIKLAENEVNR